MALFTLSPLARACLLAFTAGTMASPSLAASPWHVTDGTTREVTGSYSASDPGDSPLLAVGAGSRLETASDGLSFRARGNNLHAADIRDGGSILLGGAILTTQGTQAHGVRLRDGSLTMSGGSISAGGMASAGILGSDNARIGLDNVSISVGGQNGSGITLNGGELDATGVTITATGAGSSGISLAYATAGSARAMLENVSILMRGDSSPAGLMIGNANVQGRNVTVSATGETRGVDIYNITGGRGQLTLSDSLISTESGDALYLLGGEAALENVTAETTGGMAINVNKDARVSVQGGHFSTLSDNAHAAWLATADSYAGVSAAEFRTRGDGSHVFNAQYGKARLTDSSLTSEGNSSYGLYTESEVIAEKLSVLTEGNGSTGIFAARGGEVALKDAQVITQGSNSAGLML